MGEHNGRPTVGAFVEPGSDQTSLQTMTEGFGQFICHELRGQSAIGFVLVVRERKPDGSIDMTATGCLSALESAEMLQIVSERLKAGKTRPNQKGS